MITLKILKQLKIYSIFKVFDIEYMLTKLKVVMIHSIDITSEIYHELFNFHPTFSYELASANS